MSLWWCRNVGISVGPLLLKHTETGKSRCCISGSKLVFSLQICFPILHPDALVWHLVAINCEIHVKFLTKIFLLTFSVPVRLLQLITCSTKQSLVNQAAQTRVYIWCKRCGGKKCEHVYLWTACRSTHVWCHKVVASCCQSGRCTQHSPSCHPPRSYLQWKTSLPAQRLAWLV